MAICEVETKFCPACETTKDVNDFSRRGERRQSACKECMRGYQRRILYGLDPATFQTLLNEQDNSCAICHRPFSAKGVSTPRVDHCHNTGDIRGLLCHTCNAGLGQLGDTIERLRAALDYLMPEQEVWI